MKSIHRGFISFELRKKYYDHDDDEDDDDDDASVSREGHQYICQCNWVHNCVVLCSRSPWAPSSSPHHHAEGFSSISAAFWWDCYPPSIGCLSSLPFLQIPSALRESHLLLWDPCRVHLRVWELQEWNNNNRKLYLRHLISVWYYLLQATADQRNDMINDYNPLSNLFFFLAQIIL